MLQLRSQNSKRFAPVALAVLALLLLAPAAMGGGPGTYDNAKLWVYSTFGLQGEWVVGFSMVDMAYPEVPCDYCGYCQCDCNTDEPTFSIFMQLLRDNTSVDTAYGNTYAQVMDLAMGGSTYSLYAEYGMTVTMTDWFPYCGSRTERNDVFETCPGSWEVECKDDVQVTEAPLVASVDPTGDSPGQSGTMYISGWYFGEGASVSVSGGGVDVSVVDISPMMLTCQYSIDEYATPSVRSLTVTVNNQGSNQVDFTVYEP